MNDSKNNSPLLADVHGKALIVHANDCNEIRKYKGVVFSKDGKQLSQGDVLTIFPEYDEEKIEASLLSLLNGYIDTSSMPKTVLYLFKHYDKKYLSSLGVSAHSDGRFALKTYLVAGLIGCASIVCHGATETLNGIQWKYQHCDDGIAIIESVIPDDLMVIDIPDYIDEVPVVEIASCAIASEHRLRVTIQNRGHQATEYASRIYQIKLPARIKRIKDKAFFERNVSGLEFPPTLEELDQYAFGYWIDGGVHENGATFGSGAYPMMCTGSVIFWGSVPRVTNNGGLKYSSSFTSSTGNYLFWNTSGRVYVDEKHYDDFVEYRGYPYYKMMHKFGDHTTSIGFTSMNIERNPQDDNGYGNVVALTSMSTNNPAIYYTVDGSDPVCHESENCFLYDGTALSFACSNTIKALAYVASYPYTKCETMEFRIGTAVNPINVSTQGEDFWLSKNMILIASKTTDATIRYTLDGSPVTTNSPIYTAPFAISGTTTVRAKAFKEDWFDSEEVVQTFTRLWYTNETPVVSAAAETFDTTSQEVTLSCDTEDATIYYTIDGSEPSATNGRVYRGPFDIYQTTTVKAIAVKDDWKDSAVASATFTKENEIGPAINMLEVLPDNDKTHPWMVVSDVTHDGVSAARSGEIEEEESTTLKVTVYGAGQLSFWWKTSCEPSIGGEYYDYATFYNGSTAITNLAGVTDWQQVWLDVPGTGKHTFKWTYQKDDSNSTVPDGMWLDQVQWMPVTTDYYSDHTLTTETPVKYNWLRQYGLGVTTDFESAAKAKSGKYDGAGRELTVEQEYIAGTDPTNMTSYLTSSIEMVDGLPVITWNPDLNEGGAKNERLYKIWGSTNLVNGGEWEWPTNALHRFFKVTVEMP